MSFLRPPGDSPWTWIQHAVVSVAAPPLVPLLWGGGGLADAVLVSGAVLLGFSIRELKDWRKKVNAGTWEDKWGRDAVGDMLGAAVACLCYVSALLVS